MSLEPADKRLEIRFYGSVQGVGFRYTVCQLAKHWNVIGFVRNEFDGSVLVIAEGAEAELLGFVNEIRVSRLQRYIRRSCLNWEPARHTYSTFGVAY
ncbi:MAG: acylphosphatase [Spartobacteria bacterium]|nr:acylphosphatase [Spartobacteria bacterium]